MLALLALAGVALSACSPTPEPTPTAAFASEEEAFAAAEETYRAYTDALNAQRADGDSTDPAAYLTGLALEDHLESERDLAERKLRVTGETRVQSFTGTEASIESEPAKVAGIVCLNIADTRVLNAKGEDVTPSDRSLIAGLAVELTSDKGGFSISSSSLAEDAPC